MAVTGPLEASELAPGGVAPLSFRVEPGGALVVGGASGAGKTRLLRALADLEPHRGEVCLDGVLQGQTPAPDWRRRVALVPAESAWWLDTAGAHFDDWPPRALDDLGLAAALGARPVSQLSSGERMRLAVLRAWQQRPRVLLIDEPGANLDDVNRDRLETLLNRWRREHGVIAICAGHDAGLHRRLDASRIEVRPT